MDVRRINLDLPSDLWRRVSVRAAEKGIMKKEVVKQALEQWLERSRQVLDWTCEICSASGQDTPATQRITGRYLCDTCAEVVARSIEIGPAIWTVMVSDPMTDGAGAVYESDMLSRTVYGYSDRDAAEALAAKVGSEAREAYLVTMIGGDAQETVAEADLPDAWKLYTRTGGPAGVAVVWPHSDPGSLRDRLLHGKAG